MTTSPSLETWGAERSRTVTWNDPMPTIAAGLTMSGLDYLTAMLDGRLPASPIGRLVGIEGVSVSRGDVVFRCVPDESAYNPVGLIHGGLISTLLDSATASAVHSTLDAGVAFTTLELKVSFMRPVHAGQVLLAHGWVTKPGSRVSFAEADIRDADDRLVATASSTLLIQRVQ
ncbi:PaaI family thioesterase [Antrihabitans stalactiti]|uniref:PaaI family thioesterase n=1 Tax=Antrihabitans stalactiti TaxID=2584121 RepID=A0A848KH21_9NOCA|nr:PaaI family thioesterase [Antrihabitans stalactiti]NMN97028.1 PaaI family thioesterase [Antrihabitans stalactiti]